MKKYCKILLFLIIVLFGNFPTRKASAVSESMMYAKVFSDCVLYKSPNLSSHIDNVYFVIPETYFVVVLEEFNECFKVQYDRYVGYVKKDKITKVSFVPIVKFLENVTVDIKSSAGTQVWNRPTTSGTVLTVIPAGTCAVKYIAVAHGEIPSGGNSDCWYYVLYTPSFNSTSVFEGYIYSENTINLSPIFSNIENDPEIIDNVKSNDKIIYLSSTVKTILIAVIAIPIILLFLIILYKLSKKFVKNTKYIQNTNNNKTAFDSNPQLENGENNSHSSLKSSLLKLSKSKFIRKPRGSANYIYPSFPNYESEDDLL
ncbi:MAG: hypothetical protein IKB06_04260 [Clostridia bacterium]|nr:hypothetical protein [Clostridia bacterium]